MKKNKFSVFGMLAMVLAFGLAFVSCDPGGGDEPYDGQKTIKITGYSSHDITAYVMFVHSESAGPESWPPIAYAIEEINGQTILYPLANWDYPDWENPNSEPWTGTGKFFIVIECDPPKYDSSKDGSHYIYSVDGTNPTAVDITDEVTTLEWSKFIWLNDYTAG